MSTFKKTLTLLMAALMLTQCVACQSEPETTTPAPVTTEDPMDSLTPGIATLTDEEKASYSSLAQQNADRAHEIAKGLEKKYITGNGTNLKVAMYLNTKNGNAHGTASVWHLSAVLTMTSKLWSIDAGGEADHYEELYGNLLGTMDYHKGTDWITSYNGTTKRTMYAVNRAGQKGKASLAGVSAVYDDQMWIIRELIYAYQLTKDEAYLTQALDLTETCIDGWDVSVVNGKEIGGIAWGPGYESKHTCSNAPLIQPLVELYEIFRDEGRENADYYLAWADTIYQWTKKHLDTGNGIYGDSVRPSTGRIEEGSGKSKNYLTTSELGSFDKNAYSYNTGAMISGAAALYRATGDEAYLTYAKKCAKASYRTFGKETNEITQFAARTDSVYASTAWFNLILLEGYLDLFPYDTNCKTYIAGFQESLDYAYENYLESNGLLPRDLLNGWNLNASNPGDAGRKPDLDKDVMDQAAYAEMYAQLAEYYTYLAAQ